MPRNNALESCHKSKKILLVEDNDINVKVIELFLDDCGLKDVAVARNGKDALKLFSSDFGLVILDIGLPDLPGTEVCKRIRKKLNGKSLPVIAYTANELTEKECQEAGIDEVLAKPLTFEKFNNVIQRYLGFNNKKAVLEKA